MRRLTGLDILKLKGLICALCGLLFLDPPLDTDSLQR